MFFDTDFHFVTTCNNRVFWGDQVTTWFLFILEARNGVKLTKQCWLSAYVGLLSEPLGLGKPPESTS